MELYKKYRPQKLDDMIGQEGPINILQNLIKKKNIPHALLFHGPSGCGKTTAARIMGSVLDCRKDDFVEINASLSRGIDTIKEINKRIHMNPIGGGCRIWSMDEAHQLNSFAQNALLKLLEDTPENKYFILCTTNPEKFLRTIRTRCTEIKMSEIPEMILAKHAYKISKLEKQPISKKVAKKIAEYSQGSARKAMVLLEQVIDISEEKKQLDYILKGDTQTQVIELCRLLMKKSKWSEVAAILRDLDEEPETIRRIIIGYFNSVLLKDGRPAMQKKAWSILESFEESFMYAAPALVTQKCYEALGLHS